MKKATRRKTKEPVAEKNEASSLPRELPPVVVVREKVGSVVDQHIDLLDRAEKVEVAIALCEQVLSVLERSR